MGRGSATRVLHWATAWAIVVLALLVTFGLPTLPAPAGAQERPDEAPFFWDLNEDPDAGWVAALADAGITDGCDRPLDGFFCPQDPLLREQAAAWLVRARGLPLDAPSPFVDDDDSPFEAEIAAAAAAGILLGCDADAALVCPQDPVSVREFGWMLDRAFGGARGLTATEDLSRAAAAALLGPAAGLQEDATLAYTPSRAVVGRGLEPETTYSLTASGVSAEVTSDSSGQFVFDLPPFTETAGAGVRVSSETRAWRALIALDELFERSVYGASADECNGRPYEPGAVSIAGDGWFPSRPVELRFGQIGSLYRATVVASSTGRIESETLTPGFDSSDESVRFVWGLQQGPDGMRIGLSEQTFVCNNDPIPTTTTVPLTTTTVPLPTTTAPPATTVPPTTQAPTTSTTTAETVPSTTLPDADSVSAEALEAIRGQLRPGTVEWPLLEELEVGVTTQFDVTVTLDDAGGGEGDDEPTDTNPGSGTTPRLASFVRVTLEGSGFRVDAVGGEPVRPLIGPTTWIFDVEPIEAGMHVLTLEVQPIVELGGTRNESVESYIARQTITVIPSQVVLVANEELVPSSTQPTTTNGASPPVATSTDNPAFSGAPWWLLLVVLGLALMAAGILARRRRPSADAPVAAAPSAAEPAVAAATSGALASARVYKDFDLSVSKADDGGYVVTVDEAPRGQDTTETFEINTLDLERRMNDTLGPQLVASRAPQKKRIVEARELGSILYDALFAGSVGTALVRSIDKAEEDDTGLRIRIDLDAAPELGAIPWEFLYQAEEDRFLSASSWWPIVRMIPAVARHETLEVDPPLRILVMASNPKDYVDLDSSAELDWIHDAVSEYADGTIVQVVEVAPTFEALQEMLQNEHFHVFHFIGHGDYDAATQDGQLLMCDADGNGKLVSGRVLGDFLAEQRGLRLAILNSCEGAKGSESDRFAGTAEALARKGIPAVVAMQFNIPDSAALAFSRMFYRAIVHGFPVDGAVAEARRAVRASDHEVEWAIPVLYLSTDDGRLFDFTG